MATASVRVAVFSGVRLEAWCVMDDHFHIVCEVVWPDAPVPDAALLRRVAQVGNGKIFGGYAFVMRAIFCFGDCFAGHPVPRPVFAGGKEGVFPLEAYASHGWRKAG